MSEIVRMIAALRRPNLLIRAARLGAQNYRRERDLRRLLGPAALLQLEGRLAALLVAEAAAEATRQAQAAGYNLSRHLDLLIALSAEMQLAGGGGSADPL